MRVILVLHNIRSTYNVGAMLRTLEGFFGSDSEVVFSGVTPCFCRPGLLPHLAEKLERQIAKTALGAEKLVSCSFSEDILGFLEEKKRSHVPIVGLENNLSDSRVVRLSEISTRLRGFSEVVLIVGEEVDGISREILGVCDWLAEIPMRGQKESFNVSVATGVALYEILRCAIEP